ncbi:MAG: glyoxalase/bleomycin resistance/extradiol dioxygenase family protein [Myxococcota bacterium]|nr:glyoxalase/bleomycin resistance/extradiol dioxygenase family protein [Myxococcota bacterium]
MATTPAAATPAATSPTSAPAPKVTGVTPYISVRDATAAAAFYQRAFGAAVVALVPMSEGTRIIHGYLIINNGPLFLSDPFPEHGHPLQAPQAFALHLQVDDADAWFDRAVAAGAEVIMPISVQFWGDRYGQIKDPFGVTWSIGGPNR